jgi:trk system potassium uptake protein TrkA
VRIVVVGAGKVGKHMAADLSRGGHDVLVLDNAREVVERAQKSDEYPGVEFRVADACEVTQLEDAGLAHADVVAAVTGDDEDNLVVSLLAKQEFGVPRVVARVNHPKNEWLFNETWGVDVSVSTPHLLTALVEEAVTVGTLVRLLQFEGGKAGLEEVTLADSSPAAGKQIADLRLPRTCTIVAVIREQTVIVPRGDVSLEVGDEVIVLSTAEAEADVKAAFIGTP